MADALTRIVQELGQVECSDETRRELTWSCRELLESMELHPAIGKAIFVPDGPFALVLNGGVQWSRGGAPARHPKVTLQLAPGARESDDLKQRWRSLGFFDKIIAIKRDDVRTPAPLKGEPGYAGYQPGRPSVHRPERVLEAEASQTYAHALAVEANGPKPRLDRYRAGERARVWGELLALGAGIRGELILPDAVAVARETMRRCRANIERLAERRRSMRYQFRNPDEVFVRPDVDVLVRIAEVESRVGPLPLSLCAWYQIVGSVDFTGSHPDWPEELTGAYPDPLVVHPSSYILGYDEENWHREEYGLCIAPDGYHKEDVSGGPPYTIMLPNPAIDAPLENDRHATTFVDYLRICVRWGAFPGWERLAGNDRRSALLDQLTQGLLAF